MRQRRCRRARARAEPRSTSAKRVAPADAFGEIIDAAARVFAERGYHGATTQDIADVLGIRQASLYYYFPSKEVALELVCMRGVEAFMETGQAIADGPGTAGERLSGLIRAHISPLLDRGDYVKVFLTQRQFLPTESRRRVASGRAIWSEFSRTWSGKASRNGEFRADVDTRLVTLAILGMANWVSQLVRPRASVDRAHRQRVRRG